jgi:ATP synthase protein I
MPQNRKPEKFMKDWFRYGGIGVEMLASVLIGTLGGYGLDYLLHTRPWLMIVGFILGSAAGFRSIFRLINQDQDKEKKH